MGKSKKLRSTASSEALVSGLGYPAMVAEG